MRSVTVVFTPDVHSSIGSEIYRQLPSKEKREKVMPGAKLEGIGLFLAAPHLEPCVNANDEDAVAAFHMHGRMCVYPLNKPVLLSYDEKTFIDGKYRGLLHVTAEGVQTDDQAIISLQAESAQLRADLANADRLATHARKDVETLTGAVAKLQAENMKLKDTVASLEADLKVATPMPKKGKRMEE